MDFFSYPDVDSNDPLSINAMFEHFDHEDVSNELEELLQCTLTEENRSNVWLADGTEQNVPRTTSVSTPALPAVTGVAISDLAADSRIRNRNSLSNLASNTNGTIHINGSNPRVFVDHMKETENSNPNLTVNQRTGLPINRHASRDQPVKQCTAVLLGTVGQLSKNGLTAGAQHHSVHSPLQSSIVNHSNNSSGQEPPRHQDETTTATPLSPIFLLQSYPQQTQTQQQQQQRILQDTEQRKHQGMLGNIFLHSQNILPGNGNIAIQPMETNEYTCKTNKTPRTMDHFRSNLHPTVDTSALADTLTCEDLVRDGHISDKTYPKPVYSYSCLIAMALKNIVYTSLLITPVQFSLLVVYTSLLITPIQFSFFSRHATNELGVTVIFSHGRKHGGIPVDGDRGKSTKLFRTWLHANDDIFVRLTLKPKALLSFSLSQSPSVFPLSFSLFLFQLCSLSFFFFCSLLFLSLSHSLSFSFSLYFCLYLLSLYFSLSLVFFSISLSLVIPFFSFYFSFSFFLSFSLSLFFLPFFFCLFPISCFSSHYFLSFSLSFLYLFVSFCLPFFFFFLRSFSLYIYLLIYLSFSFRFTPLTLFSLPLSFFLSISLSFFLSFSLSFIFFP
ncbi:FOXN [Acanthosepion pharaonis]|uniref:FOXN n=1 Tax=Acanthosepion pharaonis TaxID=158019 RepID=A0A812E8N0_ACAPH|nr:FOXN [Sepia pharaonis]